MLVGDSGYPLTPWLIKPYAFNNSLTPEQKHLNYWLSRARIVMENAFGRLKVRWRRLLKQNDMQINNTVKVVIDCCILHNMYEIHGETFVDEWMNELESSTTQVDSYVNTPS